MDSLNKQVSIAWRRLLLQRFARNAAWCWFAAWLVAAIAIGVTKIWAIPVDPWVWSMSWLGGALVAGAVAAGIWTWLERSSALAAALEIDRRFGLKERLSSSLALSEEQRYTKAGRALLEDTASRVERINVADRFELRVGRRALLPLAAGLAAFGVAIFFDSKGTENSVEATTSASGQKQVQESTKALQKKLAEQRKDAKEKGLEDADGIFKKLEEGTRDLAKKEGLDRKQAMVKLNDLTKDLEQRRQKLASDEKLKDQLKQLKAPDKGPADKLAQAMKNGEFGKAVKELDKLQKKLNDEKELNAQDKEQLAKQLNQMQKAIKDMAKAHEAAKRDLQKQIEKQRQAGQNAEADKLQQQLDQLCQQDSQMSKASQMAKKLASAAKAMQQGQAEQAQKQLEELSKELGDMQKSMDEMEMLEDALQQIADAKSAMSCKNCGGAGCEHCQGGGDGRDGDLAGKGGGDWRQKLRNQRGGDGLGPGAGGHGNRPEEKDKTKLYDSTVKQNLGKGAAVVAGQVDGPNIKGQVQEEVKSAFENAQQEAADPLTGQRLPRDYRDKAGKYFDNYRKEH